MRTPRVSYFSLLPFFDQPQALSDIRPPQVTVLDSSSTMAIPIWNRKRDLIYLIFFLTHIPIMFCKINSLLMA